MSFHNFGFVTIIYIQTSKNISFYQDIASIVVSYYRERHNYPKRIVIWKHVIGTRTCMECKCAREQIQFIESRSIQLPHLLVIAFPSASRLQNLEIPDVINLGEGYSYEVVVIALWNTEPLQM